MQEQRITSEVQATYERLRHFPNQMLLETTSHCNLNCLMCARQFKPRKWGTMDEALARKILDEVVPHAPWCRIWFCYFGEPLIRRRAGLFERIRYAKELGLERAVINTNGNLMDDRCVEDMLSVGLDEVYVGIDAADAATYSGIRCGGDYDKVIRNVHRLLERAAGRIKVTVQYGVYDENEHQVEQFKEYWSQYPVHVFIRPKLTWCGYLEDRLHEKPPRYACSWIFDSININDDGRVPYCVTDWPNRLPAGDARTESVVSIWQEKIYPNLVAHARQDWDKLPDFCRNCPDWQTKPPKADGLMALFARESR